MKRLKIRIAQHSCSLSGLKGRKNVSPARSPAQIWIRAALSPLRAVFARVSPVSETRLRESLDNFRKEEVTRATIIVIFLALTLIISHSATREPDRVYV